MEKSQKLNLVEKLTKIQKELKAPKNQYNAFGKYKYRSTEDILEGLKPLLDGCTITIDDEIVEVAGRIYVKATAYLHDSLDFDAAIQVSAFAREPETQKGMNEAQITGSASSYARKYALNGLFLIDDTKDADTQDNSTEVKKPAKKSKPNLIPNNSIWDGVIKAIKEGFTIEQVKSKYTISEVNEAKLKEELI